MKFLVLCCVLISISNAFVVNFFLSTRENQNNPVQIFPNDTTKHLKSGLDIHILIHGWHTNMNETFYRNLSAALFAHGDHNIITTDYSTISEGLYSILVLSTSIIADEVADLIVNLVKTGFPLKTIHLIGHSVGAHIAGRAGEYVLDKLGEKLPRITGLDPAGPGFYGNCLNPSNAKVVFVIHTTMGTTGIALKIGTTDVYPNEGILQPGCTGLMTVPCSHSRSHEFLTSAVANPGSMLACKCSSYEEFMNGECDNNRIIDLGGNITLRDRGNYFLQTNNEAPFRSIRPPSRTEAN